jgi:hypothetical protein
MPYLKRNLPVAERLVRLALALALAAVAGFLLPAGLARWAGFAAAATAVLTGLVGFCPACALAGRRSVER